MAFTSTRISNAWDLFVITLDTGHVDALVTGPLQTHAPNWSRDGRYIAYHTIDPQTADRNIGYLDLSEEDAQPQSYFPTTYQELLPQISPGGRYLAYQSNEHGRWDVIVRRFPSGERKEVVSVNGGMHPRWSRSGDELFYLEGPTLMAVSVRTEPALDLGMPERLLDLSPIGFTALPIGMPDFPNYNVDNDGEHFIAVQVIPGESGRDSRLVVVQNWWEQFRQ